MRLPAVIEGQYHLGFVLWMQNHQENDLVLGILHLMRESGHTRNRWEATLKEPEECSIVGDSWNPIKKFPNVFLLGKIQMQGEWVIWKHLKRFLIHYSFKDLIIRFDQEANGLLSPVHNGNRG